MKGRDHWCGGSCRWLEVQQMSSADLYWAYAKWECGGGIKMLLLQPIHVMHRYLLFFLLFFLFLILFLGSGHTKLTTHHPSAFLAALQCKGYLAAEPLACVHQTQAILIRLFAFNITLPGSISKPCCPPMAIKGDTGDEPM